MPTRYVSIYFSHVITLLYNITKTCLYNFDPLKPHFYIVKLGFAGVYIIFVISAQNINCGYLLEPPRRGGSNEYPQSMFWAEIWKNIRVFVSENFQFLEVKFSIYLKRRVFVMIFRWFTYALSFLSNPVPYNIMLCICEKCWIRYCLKQNSTRSPEPHIIGPF